MKDVVIVGASDFGREVLEIFKDQNSVEKRWNILGFIDDKKEPGTQINGYPILGNLQWLKENKHPCIIAIGDPGVKESIAEELRGSVEFVNAIHPSVIKSDSVEIGAGVIICAGCILTCNIVIKDFVTLNLATTVGHDVVIEEFTSIMPKVAINGRNKLGKKTYIGSGATFIQNITIGENTTIGAGSTVIRDIAANKIAVGVPCKEIKSK